MSDGIIFTLGDGLLKLKALVYIPGEEAMISHREVVCSLNELSVLLCFAYWKQLLM